MARQTPAHRRARLCKLLRQTGFCFLDGTAEHSPAGETAALRHEMDCLITLYEGGHLDPVAALRQVPLNPEDPAPLHGGQ